MTPEKILVVKLRALGDTILMTAPLLELRRAFPKAQIHVLARAEWAGVLKDPSGSFGIPDRIWTYSAQGGASWLEQLRLILSLRREQFEWAINLHASPSTARLCRLICAPERAIHFHGHRTPNRYSTVEIPGKGTLKPIIERDMDVLRALGLQIPEGRLPEIIPSPAETAWARSFIQSSGLKGPILGLGLGASLPSKCWPLESFFELASEWIRRTSGSALAVVAQSEAELGHAFMRLIPGELPVRVTESLSLRRLAAVLSQMNVFVGNDSGPRHLATAVRTPTVTLVGPADPFEWHPYPRDLHPYFFLEGLDCRKDADPGMPPWCGARECPLPPGPDHHRCMKRIDVAAVLKEATRISREPAS